MARCCACGSGCRASECGALPGATIIHNPSGLRTIRYRVGTFPTFRRELLRHLPVETELDGWRPTADTDLGLQVIDWWAYLADVLTFYNERIANEQYLGTAEHEVSVRRLTALLGYRPRPGIGAVGTVAVVAAGPAPVVIPAGTAIASKAVPGIPAQTFEVTRTSVFNAPTTVRVPVPDDLDTLVVPGAPSGTAAPGSASAAGHSQLIARGGVLLKGTPTSIGVGDRLLLRLRAWSDADPSPQVVQVTGLAVENGPDRRKNTRVLLSGATGLDGAHAADYTLQRATRTSHLASLPAGATVATASGLVIDGAARYLEAGDPLLVEVPGGAGVVIRLTSYTEAIWYANGTGSTPETEPAGDTKVPLVVAKLVVDVPAGRDLASFNASASSVVVRSGWTDAGTLIDTPVATLSALPGRLILARRPAAPAGAASPAFIQDAHGNGAAVMLTPESESTEVRVEGDASVPLAAPLTVLWDLVELSRGEMVRDERLGTGDPAQSGQDFVLSKSPVTFLTDYPGRSGDGWSSTVELRVDGRQWQEVPSLFGCAPEETVFETRVDERGETHVRTPDGSNGRRLTRGAAVTATYRFGSGEAVPPSTTLTQVLTAVPNLLAVRNPVAPTGGADPEPAATARKLAPRTVLTFGRAVSADDYAAIAAAAPGVRRASARMEWDAVQQCPAVHVWVGDDPAAVAAARTALAAQADPHRPLAVLPAVSKRVRLRLTVAVDPAFVSGDVVAAVAAVLLDDERGPFAPASHALGERLYRSELENVIADVPGVLGTSEFRLLTVPPSPGSARGAIHRPGPGTFFTLAAEDLELAAANGVTA